MIRKLLCIALLAAAPLAMATSQSQLSLEDSNDFRAQRAEIEKGLADGETYAEIKPADRTKVRESLDRIANYLDGVDSVEEMDVDDRVALFNEQELVNTILTKAASDSRLVCDRDQPTGSRLRKTTCQTVAERNRRREADTDHLRRNVMNGVGPKNN